VPLRSVFISAHLLDRRLTLWLGALAALAALNVGLWVWIARFPLPRTPYAEVQLLLSGVYVGVCGFRSLFPRVDLERVCLWDSWLSAIVLGRTAATIAEVCFSVQCALFVGRLSEISGLPMLAAVAGMFVPMCISAQLVCWYAVLSLNHIGHAIEETLWALMMLLLSAACGTAAFGAHGLLGVMLSLVALTYGVAACLTIAVDVRMYVRRWRLHAANGRLSILTGFRDSRDRRHPTLAWDVWREEVPWMTLYFSVGVWTSLAMVVLEWAAARA
jgi:hypothetical protein